MLLPMGSRAMRSFVPTVNALAIAVSLLWGAPRAFATPPDGEIMILALQKSEASIELHVRERTARYELVQPDAISPKRNLGLLTYLPMDGKPVDRYHDIAKRWQVKGYAVNARNGRRVPVLLQVPGPLLIPTFADYFRTMQAANQAWMSKEDASRLFGMTLNSFKQAGLIPVYEQYNPR